MTRTRTIWTALGAAALGAVALAVWPARGRPVGQRARRPVPDAPAARSIGPGSSPAPSGRSGLRWRFARVQYSSHNTDSFRARYWSDPWAIDGPAAEQNLSRRVRTVTAIDVERSGRRSRSRARSCGTTRGSTSSSRARCASRRPRCRSSASSCCAAAPPCSTTSTARSSGTTWCASSGGCSRIGRSSTCRPTHPVFHCFYELDHYPQVPGLGSFFQGRTWEKGGFTPHLRAIEDDRGRAMVLINWNTDMGDGMEWSNAEEYPGLRRRTRPTPTG